MREIKFRAWDGKKMLANVGSMNGNACVWKECPKDSVQFTVVVNGETHYGYSDWDMLVERPEYKLVQFTGLRDKNGVEIYEGDIVFVRKAKEQREVVFHEGAFCVVSGGDHYTLNQTRAEGIEVVGNIYQHKHLLEE